MNFRLLLLFLSLGLTLATAGEKAPAYAISFHDEGDSVEGAARVMTGPVNGETRHFHKNPLITQKNLTGYWPFVSDDGTSLGAVFWLDSSAQKAINTLALSKPQTYLVCAFNGNPIDILLIDRPPDDNKIVVWKGLSADLFTIFDEEKRIKRMGDDPMPSVAGEPTEAKPEKKGFSLFSKKKTPKAKSGPEQDEADKAVSDLNLDTNPKPASTKKGKKGRDIPELPFVNDDTIPETGNESPNLTPLPEPAAN
jgi:hypothetical protein